MSKRQDAPDATGHVVGSRYLVEQALGRGGMAAVYRVRDSRTGQKLALKRSSGRRGRQESRRRASLEREFQTLAHLTHPRIIEVYDYGVDDFGPFYTMELLDGADLDKSGQLPWREACALLRDVVSSLAILHSRGLIHRDISARNVRRTADGRAKLIDFGAMASIGVASDAVGTPPFMAPEVLQMQALDARADLFSIGALGYYLLTGRHAYPARRLSDLRDAWRSRPQPPARFAPDAPAALSQLILQLLSLDRGARPQTAAEVMERLCAIAELPVEDLGEISRAYLAMPTLVGREQAQIAIRSQMLSLLRGDGGTLLIEGVAGSGRSRLLDVCVLEGKLMGAHVVRADASDSVLEWGVARALGTQLFELFPKQAAEVSRLSQDVLGHVIDELRRESSASVSMSFPDRSLILRELRDFVLGLARGQKLLIVVDDADAIDDPSAALLAAIADKAERQSLFLAVAAQRGSERSNSPSLQLLASIGRRIPLEPLDQEQTESLTRSVFGEVANLPLCAARVFGVAQGNPRTTMELLQHLVDSRVLRYEAGTWLLPSRFDEVELPDTLSASLRNRLDRLSKDARELAEALCLADGYPLPLVSYRALTTHRDQKRVFRALQELVAERVLIAASDGYRFSQRGLLTVLREALPAARSLALHGRIAALLAASGGDPLRRAHHLLQANRHEEAIGLLRHMDLFSRLPPLHIIEPALEYAERDTLLPPRAVHQLRMALLIKAPLVGAIDSFRRSLPHVLAQLERDSGLLLYRELGHAPETERLAKALAMQQQRFLETPEDERVYSVGDALRELARLSGATSNMAVLFFDLELLESFPSLEPLLPLSPALRVVAMLIDAGKAWIRGQRDKCMGLYERALERISEPDRAGLDELQFDRVRLGVHYALALIEASLGAERAEERAKILESHRSMRVSAWRVRMLLRSNQGNVDAARKCLRRAELLQLQDTSESHYLGSTAGFELGSSSLAGDLLGVKTAVDAITTLAQQHSGWYPVLLVGQSRYQELRGNPEAALDILLQGLEVAPPGRHVAFTMLASAHVRLLCTLGRSEEAVAKGEEYLQICARDQLTSQDEFLRAEHALALAHVGQTDAALQLIEATITWAQQAGASGLPLGLFYETAARIALVLKDRSRFEQYAGQCAEEYRKGSSLVLGARVARLLEEATLQRVEPSESTRHLPELLVSEHAVSEREVVRSRLVECVDETDRARVALTMLLQSAESFQGYLFGVNDASLRVLAGLPELAADGGMMSWLDAWLHAEREAQSQATSQVGGETVSQRLHRHSDHGRGVEALSAFATDSLETSVEGGNRSQRGVPSEYVDADGRRFEAVLMTGDHRGEQLAAAVLVLHAPGSRRRHPASPLMRDIASHMLEVGDVVGGTLG